jgi:hypothetical protein
MEAPVVLDETVSIQVLESHRRGLQGASIALIPSEVLRPTPSKRSSLYLHERILGTLSEVDGDRVLAQAEPPQHSHNCIVSLLHRLCAFEQSVSDLVLQPARGEPEPVAILERMALDVSPVLQVDEFVVGEDRYRATAGRGQSARIRA